VDGDHVQAVSTLRMTQSVFPSVDANDDLPLFAVASCHGRLCVALSRSEVDVAVPALKAMSP